MKRRGAWLNARCRGKINEQKKKKIAKSRQMQHKSHMPNFY